MVAHRKASRRVQALAQRWRVKNPPRKLGKVARHDGRLGKHPFARSEAARGEPAAADRRRGEHLHRLRIRAHATDSRQRPQSATTRGAAAEARALQLFPGHDASGASSEQPHTGFGTRRMEHELLN